MSEVRYNGLFSMLPEGRPPWLRFALILGLQSLALYVLAWLGVLRPEILLASLHDHALVHLVDTATPENHQPALARIISSPQVPRLQPSPDALRVPAEAESVRPLRLRKEDPIPIPNTSIAPSNPPPLPTVAPKIPRQLIATNVFAARYPATPAMVAARPQIQTGGFGDPNSVPVRQNTLKPITIARLGSYDLPSSSGYGNGSGNARGTRGIVASTGFGNAVAIAGSGGEMNTSRDPVRRSGFSDTEVLSVNQIKPKATDTISKLVPAEIVSKPIPIYTEEARKLRVEGEVLLEVVFESSGRLKILRVVRGLGHGLDEAAVRAAEQVHFKPALRNGQPIDCAALLHIVFQLA